MCTAAAAAAQSLVGALAIDERQQAQYGSAVDYETAEAAQAAALQECGAGCSGVLTFGRCGAYAADQEADSTAVGWAESDASATAARQAAMAECSSRGGSGCVVRVWGCNSHVAEEGLDRAARREVQEGLQAAGFNRGGADGLFGPRTRSAIRSWQTSRGARATGYLDDASVAALRPPGRPTFSEREPAGAGPASSLTSATAVSAAQQRPSSPSTSEVEVVFWQSIADSTNPAEFEAYLRRFPNGMFTELAQIRVETLRAASNDPPPSGSQPSGSGGNSAVGNAGGVDLRPRPGTVFRPDRTCGVQPAGTECWMEISGQPGCYAWLPGAVETVIWTGTCSGGLAQGTGSLTLAWDDYESVFTGLLQDGKQTGHWVVQYPGGQLVDEGPYVDGQRHGHWVMRYANGDVHEGPYVDGLQHGHWVSYYANVRIPVQTDH